jgi:hypothetical protein
VIRAGEDASDIKPLKPQLEVPGGVPLWMVIAAAVAAVIVLGGLIFMFIYLLRKLTREVPEVLTPRTRALRELARIDQLRLPEQGEHRQHYELMAICLRRYVFERYHVDAPERTPRELRTELVRAGVDRYQALMIDEILIEGEVVRFGHFVPSSARAHNATRVAIEVLTAAYEPGIEGAAQPAVAAR